MKHGKKIIGYFLAFCIVVVLVYLVIKQVQEHYLQDDPVLRTLKEVLRPVHPVVDSLQLYKGDKSYTINKQKIFLCLYDENNEYYPLNMLVYVTLHEMAHLLNKKDVGHTPEFHRIFDELLAKATALNVFNPDIPIIKNYCEHN